jgi:hypothetical protein
MIDRIRRRTGAESGADQPFLKAAMHNGRRRLPLFTAIAVMLIAASALGFLVYDPRQGLAWLGGLSLVAASVIGLYGVLTRSVADVVVRVGQMEIRIHILNSQLEEPDAEAFRAALAEFALRQLRSQPPTSGSP